MQRASLFWTSLSILLMIGILPARLAAQEMDPDDTSVVEIPVEDDAPPPVPPPPPLPGEVPPPPEPDPVDTTDGLGTEELPGAIDGVDGTVTATRLNVRAGPSTRYEIVVTLNRNTRVKVYAKSGDWLKIGYPEGEFVYIHPRHLQGEIPADIPETGLIRTVQSEEAAIRVRNWERSSVVGTAQKDDMVTLVGMRGQWAKILPPATAYAWVFGKHVEHGGGLAQEGAPPPAEGTEVAETNTDGTGKDPLKKPVMSEEQRERIRKRYDVIEQQVAAQEAERRGRIDSIMSDLEAELAAIQADVEAKKEQAARQYPANVAPPPPTPDEIGGFTGWVEYVGRAGRRPAAFRLVKGGEILFLLRSAEVDLYDFVNRRVLLNGTVELAPGFEANVLIVQTIRLLDTGPVTAEDRPAVRRPYLSPDRPDLPTPPPVPIRDETEEAIEEGVTYDEYEEYDDVEDTGDPVVIVPDTESSEELEVIRVPDMPEETEEAPIIIEEPEETVEEPVTLETTGEPIEAGTDVVEVRTEEEEPTEPTDGAVVSEPETPEEDISDLPPPPPLPDTIGGDVERMAEEIEGAATVIETDE